VLGSEEFKEGEGFKAPKEPFCFASVVPVPDENKESPRAFMVPKVVDDEDDVEFLTGAILPSSASDEAFSKIALPVS